VPIDDNDDDRDEVYECDADRDDRTKRRAVPAIHDANLASLPSKDDGIRSLAASEEEDDQEEEAEDAMSPIILGANAAARPAVIPRLA
jgi:hypothetical protein